MWPFKKKTKKLVPYLKIILTPINGPQVSWLRFIGSASEFERVRTLVNNRVGTTNSPVAITINSGLDTGDFISFYPERYGTVVVSYGEAEAND